MIQKGLTKIGKYYSKFDEKPVYILTLVLHPYYKLDYIKMAWGGPEEKRKEVEAGNPFMKDWHDEALKVVEDTMQAYWEEPGQQLTPFNAPTSAADDDETLESEFDHHRRHLMQQSLLSNSGGCAAELRRYLSDHPSDVMKDTDIIKWWLVGVFFLFMHAMVLITLHRNTGIATPPLPEFPRTSVPSQCHQSHVNGCSLQVQKLQPIAVHTLVQTSLSIFKSSSTLSCREFQGSTPGCPGLDPHPYPHDTPTPTPQGGGHSCGCQGADPSGVDPRVWHLPLDHTVQVYNIVIIIYYTR